MNVTMDAEAIAGLASLFGAAFLAFEARLRPLLADMHETLRAHRTEDAASHAATQGKLQAHADRDADAVAAIARKVGAVVLLALALSGCADVHDAAAALAKDAEVLHRKSQPAQGVNPDSWENAWRHYTDDANALEGRTR